MLICRNNCSILIIQLNFRIKYIHWSLICHYLQTRDFSLTYFSTLWQLLEVSKLALENSHRSICPLWEESILPLLLGPFSLYISLTCTVCSGPPSAFRPVKLDPCFSYIFPNRDFTCVSNDTDDLAVQRFCILASYVLHMTALAKP